LLRRVERSAQNPDRVLCAGGVEVDVARRRVRRDGEPVALTATEFDLLAYLFCSPGVVRSRDEILAEVWGYRDGSGSRTVDSHVRAVRRKVGADLIRTVHGIGYAGADGEGS
ncbi:MAG TPA: winged helix-turn-helix domain-containing protein, partial [Streptosporangiaceae bacterium]|nr:winged helix-turn-helix domain-containing protein [Streptosporangiaceae bacterium]